MYTFSKRYVDMNWTLVSWHLVKHYKALFTVLLEFKGRRGIVFLPCLRSFRV